MCMIQKSIPTRVYPNAIELWIIELKQKALKLRDEIVVYLDIHSNSCLRKNYW